MAPIHLMSIASGWDCAPAGERHPYLLRSQRCFGRPCAGEEENAGYGRENRADEVSIAAKGHLRTDLLWYT
ncbi:hypothetical protein X756_14110 [Mesorhizobium sp. LSHC412B00]|nr:hypothetical protein X756_14110 [Mesorhizobium sp. LSHC412B00]